VDAEKLCSAKYNDVKYFAGKAFKTKKPIMNEFGVKTYNTASKNPTALSMFMNRLHEVAQKYKTQLIAQGFTQAKIDEILTLKLALEAANTTQNVFMDHRPVITQDRAMAFNACYAFIVEVDKAAQIIYRNNDAKRKIFVYDARGGNKNEYSGEINEDDFIALPKRKMSLKTLITITVIGTANIRSFLSTNNTTFEGTMQEVLGNNMRIILSTAYVSDFKKPLCLLLQNLSSTEKVTYKVKFSKSK